MSLYYAETSAVIKLLVEENHSKAFAAFYDAHADAEWVSSALLRIELTRAVTRALPALLPDARDLLSAFSFVAIDDDIVEGAMKLSQLETCEGAKLFIFSIGISKVSTTKRCLLGRKHVLAGLSAEGAVGVGANQVCAAGWLDQHPAVCSVA